MTILDELRGVSSEKILEIYRKYVNYTDEHDNLYRVKVITGTEKELYDSRAGFYNELGMLVDRFRSKIYSPSGPISIDNLKAAIVNYLYDKKIKGRDPLSPQRFVMDSVVPTYFNGRIPSADILLPDINTWDPPSWKILGCGTVPPAPKKKSLKDEWDVKKVF